MIVINIIFIILFILSAVLQYNDPDPYIWITLYLYSALLCWLAIRKIYKKALFIVGIIVYATYAAYLLFDSDGVISWMSDHNAENIVQSMKATKPWIEETREFFGLLIMLFALIINMVWLSRVKSREQKSNAPHFIT
jgi:hypothetical protein